MNITLEDIVPIQATFNEHWSRGRKHISRILCRQWNWFQPKGRLTDPSLSLKSTQSLETFFEKNRFKATGYKAANWILTGQTKGTAKKGHIHLKIELPVAVTTIAGNAQEGRQIITNDDQIDRHHHGRVNIDIAMCPHMENRTGFTGHMYVKEHPRLINEIPRGSKRYNLIKKIRSASERANSTMKEDLKILEKSRVSNAQRAAILASSRYKSSKYRFRRFFRYRFPIPDFKYFSLCSASFSFMQAS